VFHVLEYAAAFCALALVVWLPGALAPLPVLGRLGGLVPLARLCLGIAFWIAVLFLLAAVGALDRWGLGAVVVVVGAALLWPRRKRPVPLGETRTAQDFDAGRALLIATLSAVVVALLLGAVGPAVSWDASAYHLTLPRLYIENGGFRRVPFSVYSNWPLGTELLFAGAMLAKDYVLAKLVHFGFGVATLYALWAGCREFHRSESGWLAAALFLANGIVLAEMRIAYVDLATAFFLLSALLFAVRARRDDPGARPALLLCGVCCGVLAGLKISGIVGVAAVALVLAPGLARAGRAGWRAFALYFVVPVTLLALPWGIKAAIYTGNPVYPFLHAQLGGPDWSQALSAQFTAWQRAIGMGREPLDYLLLPVRAILSGGPLYTQFAGEIGAFWIVLIPLAIVGSRRVPLARAALLVAGASFVFWSLSSQQMRFLIPVLPLFSVAAAVAVVELRERIAPVSARPALARAIPVAAAVLLTWQAAPTLVSGVEHLLRYQRDAERATHPAVPPIFATVDRELPADAVLLFLNTNQGFFCPRAYLADSFFEASQIADWLGSARDAEEVRRRLAERGVTHVLIENRNRGIDWPAPLTRLLRDPRRARPMQRTGDERYSLYALGD
jgi:hypothetical protein